MHGDAADSHAVLERLPLRVEAREGGSSDGWMFRMRFGNASSSRRSDQPHEPGEADEADVARAQRATSARS